MQGLDVSLRVKLVSGISGNSERAGSRQTVWSVAYWTPSTVPPRGGFGPCG